MGCEGRAAHEPVLAQTAGPGPKNVLDGSQLREPFRTRLRIPCYDGLNLLFGKEFRVCQSSSAEKKPARHLATCYVKDL